MENDKLIKLQKVETDILKDFADYCEAHQLNYYLSSGTVLGAVRHQGFIPWDDDIDVSMPYDDYIKFLNLSAKEYPSKYFIQTFETDTSYYRGFGKIRLKNTTMMGRTHNKYNTHQLIWIDIIPIINTKIQSFLTRSLFSVSNFYAMDLMINQPEN